MKPLALLLLLALAGCDHPQGITVLGVSNRTLTVRIDVDTCHEVSAIRLIPEVTDEQIRELRPGRFYPARDCGGWWDVEIPEMRGGWIVAKEE